MRLGAKADFLSLLVGVGCGWRLNPTDNCAKASIERSALLEELLHFNEIFRTRVVRPAGRKSFWEGFGQRCLRKRASPRGE